MTGQDTLRDPAIPPPPVATQSRFWRPVLLFVGWVAVGLGVLGLFLPGLPTTPLMLVALWAFSKSSVKLRDWLWYHPTYGAPVRAWFIYQVIPKTAKLAAVGTMIVTVIILFVLSDGLILPVAVTVILVIVATWICTRRSIAPSPEQV